MIAEGSCDTEDWSNDAEKNSIVMVNKNYYNFIFSVFGIKLKQKNI